MNEKPASEPIFGFPIKTDPDLNPDVFWLLGADGLPLGIGTIPSEPPSLSVPPETAP